MRAKLAAVVLVVLLSACGAPAGRTLDDAGRLACDDFAEGYESGLTLDERKALASKVQEWASRSSVTTLPLAARALIRSTRQPAAWQVAADGFATACLDAGWRAFR
jgi:hypothetical protein